MYFEEKNSREIAVNIKRMFVPRDAIIPGTNTVPATIDLVAAFKEAQIIPCTDRVTPIVADTNIMSFRTPYPCRVVGVRASLVTAAATGSFVVDIHSAAAGGSILSTKITIDATERTSLTAAQPVISYPLLPDDDELTIDVDDDASGDATGLQVTIYLVKE